MKHLRYFFTGIAMGAADLVPGVSGGTIAFISGIYERLIHSIYSLNKDFLKYIKNGQILKALEYVDGKFLLSLGIGIVTAIGLGSTGIQFLLDTFPTFVFSFFSGLIIASCIRFLYCDYKNKYILRLLIGLGVGIIVTSISGLNLPQTYLGFLLAGILGSSAMILPGISGSYILLILGMYEPVLEHISLALQGDIYAISIVLVLGVGVLCGIISLGRILKKIYSSYRNQIIVAMTGLMIGALPTIFPVSLFTTSFSVVSVGMIGCLILGSLIFAILTWYGGAGGTK